jgi:DNA-binding LacI/PurR family transcriptional regulator
MKKQRRKRPGRMAVATQALRLHIVSGHFSGGSRLPTFDQLVELYQVSRATMQQAVQKLREEGFIRSVNRGGLYVSPHPPHLRRFAAAYPTAPGEIQWTRFYEVFHGESTHLFRKQPHASLENYLDVEMHLPGQDLARLEDECAAHRLAGLIIHRDTDFVLRRDEIRTSRIPAVAINYDAGGIPGVPVVRTDSEMFAERALDWLRGKKRRRLAAVTIGHFTHLNVENCRKWNLQTRPYWLCTMGREYQRHVGWAIRLLLDYPAAERPDALIIASDNLVEEALAAVHEAGLVIGRDIDIVAHCNWPWNIASPLPIARLGFHVHDFIGGALQALIAQRTGKEPAWETKVPAIFEHELSAGFKPLSLEPLLQELDPV